jgi:hypothetical protein
MSYRWLGPGPDALDAEQIDEALQGGRPLRWWAPAFWTCILGFTLTALGLWAWADADADLRRATAQGYRSTTGTITAPSTRGSSRHGTIYLTYTFTVPPLTHNGWRVGPYDGLSHTNVLAINQYLTTGATVPIKFNPTDVSDNFIDVATWVNLSAEEHSASHTRLFGFGMAIAGVIFLLAGGWIYQSAKSRRDNAHAPT